MSRWARLLTGSGCGSCERQGSGSDGVIYVETKPYEDLAPGDRVLVRGKTIDSFNADV